MNMSFGPSYKPTFQPKDDFLYCKEIEKNLGNKFNLTNEQFESLFFENGKIGETKQGPFMLCHRDSMINTIKEMDFFPTLMKLNIKEIIPGKERKVRFPINASGQRYKINENDILKLKEIENEEAKKNQKGREESEGPIGFKLLLIAYLKHSGVIDNNFEIINDCAINKGGWSYINIQTTFGTKYINDQISNDNLSTLYNENILLDINPNNTLHTIKVGPFQAFPINFKIEGLDNIENSKNIIIEKDGNYYLPKDGVSGNIKTCLIDAHAYAFKGSYKNNEGKEVVILENPRNTKEKIHINLDDIKDFCMFRKIQIDITKLLEDISSETQIHHISEGAKKDIASNLSH